MKPLVFNYLQDHSPDELRAEHGVKASVFGSKMSLNYDHIDARKDDLLANQCRGLIIRVDEKLRPMKVLAWPFDRFFNWGEPGAAPIDLEGSVITAKLDGTLIILYYDGEKLSVATRGNPEASQFVSGDSGKTYKDLFGEAWANSVPVMTIPHLHDEKTYLFELTSKHNRVVVAYDEPRITLIGVRNRETGKELEPVVPGLPSIYDVGTLVGEASDSKSWKPAAEGIRDWLEGTDPMKIEGVVACDRNYQRVKFKSSHYSLLHKLVSSLNASDRNIMAAIVGGKIDDVYQVLGGQKAIRAHELEHGLKALCLDIKSAVACAGAAADRVVDDEKAKRKRFVEIIREHNVPISAAMFVYDRKGDASDWVKSQKNPSQLDALIAEVDK